MHDVDQILHANFPSRYEHHGENAVHRFIHNGIESARKKGLIKRKSICKYIILIFVFKRPFENNHSIYCREILNRDRITNLDIYQAYEATVSLFQSKK